MSSQKHPKKPKQPVNPARLAEVMEDLCTRFIVNLPAEEFESFERLFFAIESAHWFYDDFFRENDPTLPRLPLKQFAARVFDHTALLTPYRDDVDRLTAQFQSYKQEVPTCGAALLNHSLDSVVLVRGWGPNARWGFPKGKLAKGETELQCAIREVEEETGVDITPYVDDTTYAIDTFVGDRYARIFVVPNVPESLHFQTHTRKEISDIQWVPVSVLPDSARVAKNAANPAAKNVCKDNRGNKMLFAQHTLTPFIKRLRAWIERHGKMLQEAHAHTDGVPASATGVDDVVHVQSVQDVHSAMGQSPPPVQPASSPPPVPVKKRGGRGRSKANESNVKGSSSARKSARKPHSEVARNRATFGNDAGGPMNEDERRKLFREYVVQMDRVTAERGLQDEFWPVSFVTSNDFTEEQRQEAERAMEERQARGTAQGAEQEQNGDASQDATVSPYGALEKGGMSSPPIDSFKFDRSSIMMCLKSWKSE